jgi:2-dehydropantoate 2-reductase
MRYLVLGAGALGGFFGGMLLKGGADVTFLVRPARATQLKRDGLVIKMQDGDELRTQVRTVQQGQLDGTYDVVLLTCKAYDLDSAMDAIAPAIGEQSVIVPVLNGVRHIDVLTERFGPGRVLGGLTVINAAMMADGTIQQSQLRINLNVIGELDGRASARCTAIKAALDAGGIPVQISDNILAMMWAKFFGFVCNATNSDVDQVPGGSDRKISFRRVLCLCRDRGMRTGRDGGGLPACSSSGSRHGGHCPRSFLPNGLDLWPVHADRHGRWPAHRRRTHDWRYGGTRGAGWRNCADP